VSEHKKCPLKVIDFHMLVAGSKAKVEGGYIWAKVTNDTDCDRGKLVFFAGSKDQPCSTPASWEHAIDVLVPFLQGFGKEKGVI